MLLYSAYALRRSRRSFFSERSVDRVLYQWFPLWCYLFLYERPHRSPHNLGLFRYWLIRNLHNDYKGFLVEGWDSWALLQWVLLMRFSRFLSVKRGDNYDGCYLSLPFVLWVYWWYVPVRSSHQRSLGGIYLRGSSWLYCTRTKILILV